MLSGIYQILQTPFHADGAIDWESFESQVEYSVAAGAHGLVVPALASEFFTLSDAERCQVVEFTDAAIAGRLPFVVGVQGLTQRSALAFAEHACENDATALMAMPPYLRKASKGDLRAYYRALAQFDRPLIIQNAPAPIGTPMSPAELVDLLAAEDNILYIKEETNPILQHINEIIALDKGSCAGVFGGANGSYLVDELKRGACGNMPAGGLVDVQATIYNLFRAGDIAAAERLSYRLLPLLNYATVYGVAFHKHVMWRRGVLKSPYARDPQRIGLNADDIRAVEGHVASRSRAHACRLPLQAAGLVSPGAFSRALTLQQPPQQLVAAVRERACILAVCGDIMVSAGVGTEIPQMFAALPMDEILELRRPQALPALRFGKGDAIWRSRAPAIKPAMLSPCMNAGTWIAASSSKVGTISTASTMPW